MGGIKGNIHSIESMSTVDGPGIRYVVFMQGCNLRCRFCHNVDTTIMDENKLYTSSELVKKILNAKEYFEFSGGGVTFSGGEPLIQIDFLTQVCQKLKENNIHIAIDTAGNFNVNDKMIKLLNYVDLVLLDIKHIDSNMHYKMTGVHNEKILEFARYLSSIGKKMWIRIVYMPGFTDINKEKLKMFLNSLKSVEKIEILPYHRLGIKKWEELGLKYTLNDMKQPSKEQCDELYNYLCT